MNTSSSCPPNARSRWPAARILTVQGSVDRHAGRNAGWRLRVGQRPMAPGWRLAGIKACPCTDRRVRLNGRAARKLRRVATANDAVPRFKSSARRQHFSSITGIGGPSNDNTTVHRRVLVRRINVLPFGHDVPADARPAVEDRQEDRTVIESFPIGRLPIERTRRQVVLRSGRCSLGRTRPAVRSAANTTPQRARSPPVDATTRGLSPCPVETGFGLRVDACGSRSPF